MTYANPCTVPGCRRVIHANALCQAHQWRLDTYGDTFPHVPIGAFRRERIMGRGTVDSESLGVCVCSVSRPDPKCCLNCRFPCVHRMAPHIRERALRKQPRLRDQVVEEQAQRRSA